MKRSTLIEVVAEIVVVGLLMGAVARVATAEEGPWSVKASTMPDTMSDKCIPEQDGYHCPTTKYIEILYKGEWRPEPHFWTLEEGKDYVYAMNHAHHMRLENEMPVIRMPPPPCQTGDQGCSDEKGNQ